MRLQDCYTIGRLGKALGIKGELRLDLEVEVPSAYADVQDIYVLTQRGLKPFMVRALRPLGAASAAIGLEGVKTRNDAETLVGLEVWYPLDLKPPTDVPIPESNVERLVGLRVCDELLGEIGEVRAVEDRKFQPLIVADYKGTEVLIPMSPEIVFGVDAERGLLLCRLPEGLLEVFTQPSQPDDEDAMADDDAGIPTQPASESGQ